MQYAAIEMRSLSSSGAMFDDSPRLIFNCFFFFASECVCVCVSECFRSLKSDYIMFARVILRKTVKKKYPINSAHNL